MTMKLKKKFKHCKLKLKDELKTNKYFTKGKNKN
jgi:hypothetical protein